VDLSLASGNSDPGFAGTVPHARLHLIPSRLRRQPRMSHGIRRKIRHAEM
jgi:hypothetical protein